MDGVMDINPSKKSPVLTHIAPEIWLEIFSYGHPRFLAKLRLVSKTFKHLLDSNEFVWRCARERDFPDFPEPALGLKEAEMWNLHWGFRCMVCGKKEESQRRLENIWQFKIRCCDERNRRCFDREMVTVGIHSAKSSTS